MINDHDCDVDLPCPIDEQYISDAGRGPEGQQTSPLLATIHVVRSMGQLTRTLRSPTIGGTTIETFERHFNACLATFPPQYHPRSDQYLDPRSLAPVIYLQNARYLLHRHNISPYSPPDVRSSALDYCTSTSLDTAQLLARCMQNPTPPHPPSDWRTLFSSSASTMLCTHIWRCTLLLLFRREYAAALTCVQASATIGDSRAVNTACGRYIAFFLRSLMHRMHASLDRDEEMIAYVSGDMQGTTDGSWVWQGSETGSELKYVPGSSSPGVSVPGESRTDWEGWDWIEHTIQYLISEAQKPMAYEYSSPGRAHPPLPEAVDDRLPGQPQATEPPQRPNSHSRMTIASII